MSEGSYERAQKIWRERAFPIIIKPVDGQLRVRFLRDEIVWPFRVDPKHRSPKLIFTKKFWEVPRARFSNLIPDLLNRWGAVYVIQRFTELKKCARPCRTAQGFDCECACGGEFHGIEGAPGEWIDISDTFSVKRGETFLSCRLLRRKLG